MKLMLAVAAIIIVGLIAALVEGERISINRTRYSKARAQIAELQSVLERYYEDNGFYPTSDQGLSALAPDYYVGPDPGMVIPPRPRRRPPLLDPWGHRYFYQSDGDSYVLKSFGPGGPERPGSEEASLVARSPSNPP